MGLKGEDDATITSTTDKESDEDVSDPDDPEFVPNRDSIDKFESEDDADDFDLGMEIVNNGANDDDPMGEDDGIDDDPMDPNAVSLIRVNNAELPAGVHLINGIEIDAFDVKFLLNEGSFCEDWVSFFNIFRVWIEKERTCQDLQNVIEGTIMKSYYENNVRYNAHPSGENWIKNFSSKVMAKVGISWMPKCCKHSPWFKMQWQVRK